MNQFEFNKYQGNGNDFIIIDSRENNKYDELISNNFFDIKKLCDRNFGIGADGIIFIVDPEFNNDAKMIIFNSDSSEAEMCGNGIRCLIEYLNNQDKGNQKCEYKIETKSGLKLAYYKSGQISVNMGKPVLKKELIPTTINNYFNEIPNSNFNYKNFNSVGYAVGMGNPHLIFFVDDLSLISHEELGPVFENSTFFPEKTNVHFCKIINEEKIIVKVWERGAGSTLACGTGACAVHVAARSLSKCKSKTSINLPGGELIIQWENINDEVTMTGTAENVFSGFYSFS
tara:strand:+ start:16 stop:873 length:858 start_codon:yes stop_codon:yes gene_type:complete